MEDRVKRSLGLCLVLGIVCCCVPASPIYEDRQLYVGSRCSLANGKGDGVCVKLVECPAKMREVHEGRYDVADRCSFEDFSEIVCCDSVAVKEKLTDQESPAEAACQEYGNEILPTERSISFHILGGVDVETNEFPPMAALGYTANPNDQVEGGISYTCGGTLISRQHVLTAAHCVSNLDERVPVEVRLGSTDLNSADEATQRVPVLSVIPHPAYKRSRNYNDIAIIKLKEPVRMTNSVQPACLLTKPFGSLNVPKNQTLVVLGWGVTDFDGTETTKLKKAVGLRFVEADECSNSYTNISIRLPNGLDDKMICVSDPNITRRADTCWGDSGGPLLISSATAKTVAGITAFGRACGGSTPSVYTSVYDYLSWIESHVWPSSESI